MSDITTGYTWSDDKVNWENNEATSIRLNKMIDDADVNILAGANVTVTRSSSGITIASTAGAGTVTSVAATVPSIFSIAGSPITTSGTLAMTYSGTALPQANGGTGQTTLGAGTYTATGGTTAISLADRSAQVFNVKDFGALGDNSTNDSTAINAAIAALNSATYGGCLYFPVGTYKITATLTTITNNCNILGQGQGVSQLSFQGAIDGININFTSTGRRTAAVNNLSLSSDQARTKTGLTYKQYNNSVLGNPFNFNNLTFNENWYISINVDNTALNNIQGGTIENVFISGSNSSPFPEYGIKLSGASNVTISDCAIFWSKNGIYINNSPLCEGTIISNCTVVNCKNGFDSLGTNTWLTNCYANVSATVGTGGSAFILAGNESHSSNCYCTGDDSTATGMTISGDQILVHNLRVLRAGGGRWSYGIQCSGNVNLIQNCLLLNITNAAVYFLAAADFCTAESISFNDVLGASAIANSGTNCFARSCFGLGSNTDNYWNSKPYS